MRSWFLILALFALQAQGSQTPHHGQYEDREDSPHPKDRCWKHGDGVVMNGLTFHQCPCELRCNEHGMRMEDYSCVTACNNGKQCVCHADESCPPQ